MELSKYSLRPSLLSRLGRLLYLTLPPVKTVFRILGSDRISGAGLKLSTAFMAVRLRYARAFEAWRLFFGGKYRW